MSKLYCRHSSYHKHIINYFSTRKKCKIVQTLYLGMAMGRGTSFVFPIPIPYSYILTCYPIHTQRRWEIESNPRPQWVWIFPPHLRPRSESIFLNKERVFLSFNGNIEMHYPRICAHFNIFLPNISFTRLTINESSYIMIIIKPNNMTYHYQPSQQKQKHELSTFG